MNKIKIFGFLVFALFLFQTTAFGWGDTGHMTVAQIAFNNLDSDAKRARANQLAALIELSDKDYEFVTSACWMDDIRDLPMFEPLKDWHFITQMFIVDNAVEKKPPPPVNAARIIDFLRIKLGSKRESDLKKAYYLAEIVHLVGDIHQPLHTTTRFTLTDKDGDLGGNSFPLAEDAPSKNLHSYWDSGAGFFARINRPLSGAGRTKLEKFANDLTNQFKKSDMTALIADLNTDDWAKEGFDIVVANAYKDIKENDNPSDKYRDRTQEICRRRVALAGYRLAAILNKVL